MDWDNRSVIYMGNAFQKLFSQFKIVLFDLLRRFPFFFVIVLGALCAVFYAASHSTPWTQATIALMVTTLSILVYAKTRNFAETALTFVLGAFAIFQIDWSPGTAFLVFMLILFFVSGVFVISGIQIAARQEWILTQASFHFVGSQTESLEAIKQYVDNGTNYGQLEPIQRAEIVRFFAFKKVSLERICDLINLTEEIKVTSDLELLDAAKLAHLLMMLEDLRTDEFELIQLKGNWHRIQAMPCTPKEFLEYVDESRSQLFEKGLIEYNELLTEAVLRGFSPSEFIQHCLKS